MMMDTLTGKTAGTECSPDASVPSASVSDRLPFLSFSYYPPPALSTTIPSSVLYRHLLLFKAGPPSANSIAEDRAARLTIKTDR